MSTKYVVIGAGPVGSTIARQLAEQGERVAVLTRSGGGPEHPLIERRALDANDGAKLTEALTGASAVFYAVNAPYYAKMWAAELPRAQRSVLDAAHAAGAVVVFAENLYSYVRPDEPMAEDSPRGVEGGKRGVRSQLLREREAHPADTVTMAASDFFGPTVANSHAGDRMIPRILAGKPIQVVGRTDVPHTFTYVPDMAAAMIAASRREHWNRVFHAPSVAPLTQHELVVAFAQAAGVLAPRVSGLPGWMVRTVGLFSPFIRELGETMYQFERPFVMDSAATEARLGLAPTPLAESAVATVAWWRQHAH